MIILLFFIKKGMERLNKLLTKSQLFFKRNSSTILTVIGAAGVVATTVVAVKATPKALNLLKQAEEEKGEKLTKLETVRVAAPVYIPSALIGVTTIACIFGANALNKRKQASLMSAYALLDASYKDHKLKVEELYGKGANTEVREGIAQDKYEKNDIDVEHEEGKVLFFDFFSVRYFESTMEDVLRAEYKINEVVAKNGGACLSDFYEELGLPIVPAYDELGWSGGQMFDMYWQSWVEFTHEKTVMGDGLECYIINIQTEPTCDYLDY